MEHLRRLTDYTDWANRAWLEFTYRATNNEDGYLPRMISHVYLAEQVWFQRIRGEAVDSEVFKTRPQEELRALADRHAQCYADLLGEDLDRVLSYRRFNGEPHESSLGEILLHLVTHGAHHRGQMATHAAQKQLGTLNTDYITYSRTGRL